MVTDSSVLYLCQCSDIHIFDEGVSGILSITINGNADDRLPVMWVNVMA